MSNVAPVAPIVPVHLMNPPIPSLNPFLAILYQQFLARNVWLEFFTFSANWNTLVANASGQLPTVPMNLDPSIDFIALQMNLVSYSAVGVQIPNPDYLLEIQETSSRSVWSDGPVHVGNWTGATRLGTTATGLVAALGMGFTLPFPRYIRGNNVVNFKLTNNTATAAVVNLALPGIRVTYNGAAREQLFNIAF